MTTRTERDGMGAVAVPAARYWGAQTERARGNFAIGGARMPPALVRAIGQVKRAAARVHRAADRLPAPLADVIEQAATELVDGRFDDEFPLGPWQSGSGTQTHMNVNEVIAGRANELLGAGRGGKAPVHPNDHVNLGQSSNDVVPTALGLAAGAALADRVLPALHDLAAALRDRALAWRGIVKLGRTHLMDATPITCGQQAGGWAATVEAAADGVAAALPRLRQLAIGGTAVGTGLNAPAGFGAAMVAELAALTGQPVTEAPDRFAALASVDAAVAASAALRGAALAVGALAGDLRLLGSGPRGGLGELVLPANEPGSSIMPGKVNPTQAEAALMVCARVVGNDAAIALAGLGGPLQLNTMRPLVAVCLLESAELLADAARSLRERCVAGLEVDHRRVGELVERSLMLVTALAPRLGYDVATQVAALAHAEGLSLREAALTLGVMTAEELDEALRPEAMTGG